MLLASTESSPLEPVSFTRSLPARSTKHSVPCLLGLALAWETCIGGVMLWPPLAPSLWPNSSVPKPGFGIWLPAVCPSPSNASLGRRM